MLSTANLADELADGHSMAIGPFAVSAWRVRHTDDNARLQLSRLTTEGDCPFVLAAIGHGRARAEKPWASSGSRAMPERRARRTSSDPHRKIPRDRKCFEPTDATTP